MWWLPLLWACSRPAPVPLVLMISLDTTRADALSCYGGGDTPNLDALAARGLRFDMALAQAPTTLSSHTTVMSGLDSHGHTVVRNGFPVPSDVPLLAERMNAAGWDTVAVVGSFALERDMGLDRGFRVYQDHGWLGVLGKWAVPADTVTAHVLDQVDDRLPGRPLFVFAHYYDAHRPWTRAPQALRAARTDPAYVGPVDGADAGMQHLTDQAVAGTISAADRAQARGLYEAEVAWIDSQIGVLLDGLRTRGMLDDALIVVFADHGEVLDEIPARPYQHGPDVDLGATRVPLIISGTGRYNVNSVGVVARPVRLQDVGATVLSAAGVPGALGSGQDLSGLWRPGREVPAPVPIFSEATRPHEALATEGWPNLPLERGVAADGYLLTRAPYLGEERLFRLTIGQPEVQDLAVAERLGALLDDWDARAPGARRVELDGDTREGLRALGYVE